MRKNAVYLRIEQMLTEIHSKLIREQAQQENDVSSWTRQRKMPLGDIILCMLGRLGLSAVMEIRKYFQKKKEEQTISKQGYLKQRKKLNPQVIKILNRNYLKRFYEGHEPKGWRDYLLMATDGSRAEIPDSLENRMKYGGIENKYGQGAARASISNLYDVENSFILDIDAHPCASSEIEMAKEHIGRLKEITGERKTLILFDRGYASLEFINFLEKAGVYYIIRLPSGFFASEVSQMQGNDEWVKLLHTAKRMHNFKYKMPERQRELSAREHTAVRMVRTAFSDEEQGMLMTNLPEGSTVEIRQLYRKRWKIETKYHTLKNKMKFESVTGKAGIYVQQDFYTQMLVFNIIQDLITTANRRFARKSKKKKEKYKYEMRVNENFAIGIFKEQFIEMMLVEDAYLKDALFKKLISDMEKELLPVRTLKSTPRKEKIRNKYKCNQKPSF